MKDVMIIICLSIIIGCAPTPSLNYPYTPNLIDNRGDAIRTIDTCLRQQPANFRPEKIKITDRYIKILRKTYKYGPAAAGTRPIPQTTYVNFANIGEITLHSKGDNFIALIHDLDGKIIYRLFNQNKVKVKLFIDAVYTMANRQVTRIVE